MYDKIYDLDGSYITVTQVRFFLNMPQGKQMFLLADDEFLKYLKICKAYNLVSDLLHQYPDDGFFYWDEKQGCVSFAYAEGNVIGTLLGKYGITELDFGNGKDS